MNITISIPTGHRTNQVVEVAKAWKRRGFKVAIYTWDDETRNAFLTSKYWFWKQPTVDRLIKGKQASFGVLQNLLAANTDWDVLICGADDLWPVSLREAIEAAARACPDKMIWVRDGCLNRQPTHPIITRGWYEAHERTIFNELYHHNFVDTDLFVRCALDDSVVKCFDIEFDHRHPFKTHIALDSVYRQGQSRYRMDEMFFQMKWNSRLEKGLPKIQELKLCLSNVTESA
jgi:hypothetical protein